MTVSHGREVEVTAFQRLHFGLLDVSDATPRRYGGIGVSIGGPSLSISARRDTRWWLSEPASLDAAGRQDVSNLLRRLHRAAPRVRGVSIRLRKMPPQHVGLGSKTALLLSIVAAVDRLLGLRFTMAEMQRLT